MVKFLSNILGVDIIVRKEKLRVGTVKQVIINPDTGEVAGILGMSFKKWTFAVPISEIEKFLLGAVLVSRVEAVSEPSEIIRIKQILDKNIKIVGLPVETESGQKLGRVRELTLNLKYNRLENLYVNPRGPIKIFSTELIISAKKIVEITKKKIVISDNHLKVKNPTVAPVIMPLD